MAILGKKIDIHIFENTKKMETQAGFTTGSMIEDNLFTLHYWIEGCYKFKIPLIVWTTQKHLIPYDEEK